MSRSKNEDWVSAVIIDDDLEEEVFEITPISQKFMKKKPKTVAEPIQPEVTVKKKRNVQQLLKQAFNLDTTIIEIGIDEAGRGSMFGRVYAGVAVLPKDDSFDHSQMKYSKKFHSKKKIKQVAEYIKENSIAWAVEYEDEQTIDDINILQATQSAMHKGIKNVQQLVLFSF